MRSAKSPGNFASRVGGTLRSLERRVEGSISCVLSLRQDQLSLTSLLEPIELAAIADPNFIAAPR
ncbi:hypothetical protein K239x_49530 [Planctomycetes bacterium K23_9]|uniref:Uncharacterized protein n=1 Tax=Stieleria marina TaxID=1930275 RepID=A0A517P0N9_9BACT|nr:hypothetical protein K239x_49530 [Planctomycetes bacterium K23_9]